MKRSWFAGSSRKARFWPSAITSIPQPSTQTAVPIQPIGQGGEDRDQGFDNWILLVSESFNGGDHPSGDFWPLADNVMALRHRINPHPRERHPMPDSDAPGQAP
jgi:hypothetical protein